MLWCYTVWKFSGFIYLFISKSRGRIHSCQYSQEAQTDLKARNSVTCVNTKKVAVFIQLKFKVASIIGFSAVFESRFKLLLTPNLVTDSWCRVGKTEQTERVIIHLLKEKGLVAREYCAGKL